MRSLLLALDGSQDTGAATAAALDLASRRRSHLAAVGIVNSEWIGRPQAVPAGAMPFRDALEQREMASAERRVAAGMKDFEAAAARTDLSWEACALRGDPVQLLQDAATEHDAIMVAHDACFAMDRAEGALAPCVEDLIRREPRPVILLPRFDEGAVAWDGPALVAFDGSASASRALHFFAALGLGAGRTVHVVTAGPTVAQAEHTASAACRLLSRYDCGDARAIGVQTDGAVSKAERILDISKAVGATTLAMGAYGRQGLRALFGSCTRRLIQDANVPIFLVH
ncbi:universal stress protein UspA [Alsobacter soli]|uniref:Universal stress protein UspA n=1 Tax=Alsobacter soli TaxID=2109933 RepID=A0A2T1HNE5_9HYPH|nr:universal stress protein [Alsobacter soli]PSC03180.1 universal stress protein UspA [Alsobacter soli]